MSGKAEGRQNKRGQGKARRNRAVKNSALPDSVSAGEGMGISLQRVGNAASIYVDV